MKSDASLRIFLNTKNNFEFILYLYHMRAIICILLFSFLLLIITSCNNKLKVNAPYKDIPNVYAVLCPQQTEQTIRINKTFLGEGDAIEMAKVADSINYPAGEITVTLNRFVNGAQVNASYQNQTVVFGEKLIETAAGTFSSKQRVYYTNEKLYTSGEYHLTIKNNRTNEVFKAKANAIDSVRIAGLPSPFDPKYYPFPTQISNDSVAINIDYSIPNKKYSIIYKATEPGLQARVYQLSMRFHYYDSLNAAPNNYSYVEYSFLNKYNPNDLQKVPGLGDCFVSEFFGNDLTSSLGYAFSRVNTPSNFIRRRIYMIQYIITTSTSEYSDYLQYANPSLNVAQEKPLYTNFEGKKAYGIFTFKTRCSINKRIKHEYINYLGITKPTCNYNFFLFALPTSTNAPGGYTPLFCQ